MNIDEDIAPLTINEPVNCEPYSYVKPEPVFEVVTMNVSPV